MSNGFFYEIHDDVTDLGLSIVKGILQVDQQPTSSMTMAKLHLGLSIGTGIL